MWMWMWMWMDDQVRELIFARFLGGALGMHLH
jgi:hypothetical protein